MHPADNKSLPSGDLDSSSNRISHGVVFMTYSLLVSKRKTGSFASRIDQITTWLARDPKGSLVIFDEAHKVGGRRTFGSGGVQIYKRGGGEKGRAPPNPACAARHSAPRSCGLGPCPRPRD